MYLTFYGLKEHPFQATPDPKFLYLTPGHREALAQLLYGVQENKGFILLTGEVGTGKSTLVQTLLQRLDGSTAIAHVFNCALPYEGLLEYMLEDFGVGTRGRTQAQRLMALNRFLVERRRAGQNALLIIDEAQNLDPLTFEKVRLLSNFETPAEKLLQILLVGQPELGAKLQLPELRQLRQRIGLRCNIPPLTSEETPDYIRSRLRIAGARELGFFSDSAVARISAYAGGIPRVINILCDHCLVFGYADQKREISREIVEQAIEYLQGDQPRGRAPGVGRSRGMASLRWVLGALAAAPIGWVALLALGREGLRNARDVIATYLLDLGRSVRNLLVR